MCVKSLGSFCSCWKRKATSSPAWIVESMSKNFRRLIGAVKMWVGPWYGIRHVAEISVYIQAQYRTCKITEKVGG